MFYSNLASYFFLSVVRKIIGEVKYHPSIAFPQRFLRLYWYRYVDICSYENIRNLYYVRETAIPPRNGVDFQFT